MPSNLITTTLVIAAAASVSAVHPVLDGSVTLSQEFQEWASHYGKFYDSKSEKNARATWISNRDVVIKHNAEYAKGASSFSLELNHLADLTNKEYQQQYLGFNSNGPASWASGSYRVNVTDTPPSAWDWRNTKNIVNPVKNQGSCGSCWAFSAVATMEGAVNKQTGTLNSLSEQELVDCVNGGAQTCTEGGEMYQGVLYGIKNGMMSEADYPYQGTSGHTCGLDTSKIAFTPKSYTNITAGDETALKAATYTQPIISVGIDASSIWFQLYFGGVFDLSTCHNKAAELDHGVAVVGYGTESGKDYWTVRNSWGAIWGTAGYILMSRNKDNQCGIATQACFATV